MVAIPDDSAGRIEVSTCLPGFIRVVFGVAGAAACILVVAELGRALWPPSFLTLFFGIIVFGGLSVGLSFVAAALLAPNVRWVFAPGRVTIAAELSGRTDTHSFTRRAFSTISIVEVSRESGPNTFRLDCTLADPAQARALFARHRRAFAVFAILWSPLRAMQNSPNLLTTLHSPDFQTREAAEAARAMLER